MHPPLDRPHPDCAAAIRALRQCHATAGWRQYLGACNEMKYAVDRCLRAEKKRLLAEVLREEPPEMFGGEHQEIVKRALGREMTYAEYLQQDKGYLAEVAKSKAKEQQQLGK